MNDASPNISFHSSTSPALWTLNQAILAILIWLLLETVFNMSAQGLYQLVGHVNIQTRWFKETTFVAFYVPAITIASQLVTLIYWQAWLSYFALMRQKSFNTIRNAIGLYSIGFKNFLRLLSVTVGCLLLTAVFMGWLQSQFAHHAGLNNHAPESLKQMHQLLATPLWSQLPLIMTIVASAPFFEELAFRGILQPRMIAQFGSKMGILLTTIIFVAAHAHYYHEPFLMLDIFCISLLLGWLRQHSNSLWPCIFAHAFHNTIALCSLHGF